MGISSPGIGSNLPVNDLISKLMAVESAPLTSMDKKSANISNKISAYGKLSGAISTFQSSLTSLSSLSSFQSLTSTSSDTSVMVGSATGKAKAGTYRVNISQVAQSQSLASTGHKNSTSAIGLGATTTVSFQLGNTTGGSFGLNGTALGAGMRTGGVTPGALSINNTVIPTDSSIKSAKLLADAINSKSATTGVSAKAAPTTTSATLFGSGGASNFGKIDTSGGGTYSLMVGGVRIAGQAAGVGSADAGSLSAAGIDAALASDSVQNALAEANLSFTGSAANGTLQFTNKDGSNVAVSESVTGAVSGGIDHAVGAANTGSTTTAMSSISLVSNDGRQISVGGTDPGAVGLTKGNGGAYQGATFTQDGKQLSGSVTIDGTNNSLQGIADAINKGNFGVTASIVSDGSENPSHLVLTSTSTGASSSMKISLSGKNGQPPDAALVSLLSYDPSGVQNLSQKTAAQNTLADVNGIAVSSTTTTVAGAIEGVSLTVGSTGSASLVVAKDTTAVTTSITAFVKAFNDLNGQLKTLTGYDADTKTGGILLGDTTAQGIQAQLRSQLSQAIPGLKGNLNNLSQVGIAFQKDGTLSLDSAKLQKAITNNFNDIAGLFAVVGNSSDSLIKFNSSTLNTKAGDYPVSITTLATQGSLKGSKTPPLPATTVIDADTKWVVTLNDGKVSSPANSASVIIPAGSYTPEQLATLVQSAINGTSKFSDAGTAVSATFKDGGLEIVSNRYGSKSNISIANDSGTTVATIFGGTAPTKVDGVDVAGTIGGYSATGDGQILTGSPGAPIDGMQLEVTGTTTGSRGTISFSQGYAYQMNNLASSFIGAKGSLSGRVTGLNNSIKTIADQKDAFSKRLVDIEARYRKQYTGLDTMIASMNTTSTFLAQQLAAIAANR
ncbi:flagellar filament capping protein FliD [Janthinobacterium agaricidamnosum]|uniref:Flagellar hook-associated protein 2 n=1 Tax=Janthinobacterium agaricidamnosum NBRC 102515 = DSM 9628 TaxID=1349767 RepID=W0V3P9_9BURK|nr:flagellar filament capping protein FliD [Janthinobacterium agaricidamnosum]CDG81907.1 flagellar hook-associated 2 C-terminus family protein [Janthinobacterium agaricidamnosum NBRC 102515 = DSM 9628]